MSSTYIKWILVAIALAVGVWVVARPGGKNKPGAGGSNADAGGANTGGADAASPEMDESAADAQPGDSPTSAPPRPAPMRPAPQSMPRASTNVDAPQTGAEYGGAGQSGGGPSRPGPPGNGGAGLARTSEPIVSSLGLWGDGYAEDVRDRWRDLQLRFVDDPQSVAGEAEQVVDEAVATLTASVNARKEELGTWRTGRGDDTEELRAAVARYREFLDRLLRV